MEAVMHIRQIWGEVRLPLLCFEVKQGHCAPVYQNPAADELCPKGTSLLECLSPEEASELLAQAAAFSNKEDPLFCHIRRDVYSAVFFRWEEYCVCILHDVSSYYRNIRSQLDDAVMASQAKTNFLSEMSHDIRTPMNAIIGMTDIALMEKDTPPRIREHLNKIKTASDHMMSIINEVLDMSRIESGRILLQPEEVEIADLLHEILIVARPQADAKNLHFQLEIGRIDHERIIADALRFKQICLNLLSNAIKFTPDGGSVTLFMEITKTGSDTALMSLYVKDNGIGMSREFLSRVFMPFEREQSLTISKIQGSGLGTAIAKNLVELMGGRISVESEAGKGSCFSLEIPFKTADSHFDTYRSALCSRRILLLDSSESQAKTITEMAENIGLTVDWARLPQQAVFYINEADLSDFSYFAFLTVEKQEDADLISFLPEIRRRMGSDFPILLLADSDWTQTEYLFTRAGVDAFIPLPLFRSRLYAGLYSFTEQGRSEHEIEAAGIPHHFEGRRILLVEDNELNREIAQALLGMTGMIIETAADGQEALNMFQDNPPYYYDLIFMDIQMPVMNGLDATRALRSLPRADAAEIPIIAMTANAFVEDVRRSLDAGMNAHVPKPLDMDLVFSCLERFLGGDPL